VCGMAMEAGIGLLLGFVCRIFFFGLEAAGQLIASEMGLMLTPQFNPLTHSSITAPGLLLFWMSTMILLSLDLHHWMLAGFQASYQLAPVGRFVLGEALALDLVRSTGSVFRIALQLSAPVLAASFLVTVVFSLLSRAVPQMNTFAESFPVRTLCGLLVFGLSCTLMGQYAANHLRRIPEDLHRVANLLGGG
jgi:flagellar biosynthesis protein FliR